MPFLETCNLNVGYGDIQVIHDLDIAVARNEIVSIVGSNGAGKTTILRSISGLLQPTSGRIMFDGVKIDHVPSHQIVHMGLVQVPEGRGLFHNLTVVENLRLGALNPEARKNYRESLGYVLSLFPRLEERKTQLAGTLSGGEQQMLAIGRGLMSKPKLLMMDEPSLGLAPLIRKSIFETIGTLNEEGMTILLVEQSVYHSLKLCHRGYVLENGRIALTGGGEEILQNDYVKRAYLGI